MPSALRDLIRSPIVVAPMAGGPSTPALVTAAAEAGALGFLAAGYKTVEAMVAEIAAVRTAATTVFGVNVFVPGRPTAHRAETIAYLGSLAGDAAGLGVAVGDPLWDDDGWDAKVAALLADPPPVVSFTFGCPPPAVVAALRAAGALVAITVTTPNEASLAAAAGADCLCVQGLEAGAHRATFENGDDADEGGELPALVGAVGRVTDLPLIAAGGIMDAAAVAVMRAAGAVAVQCGTAFLRCPESGAHPAHKEALADPRFTGTAMTRAFSGRPARGLVNRFMLDHAGAPPAYPEINSATRPIRAAAAKAGDLERMSLWAGCGYRQATALPAGEVVQRLRP